MKNIKVNSFTIYFLFISFLCGYINTSLIIFSIVLIHELGHVFFIKLFNYKIESINIYPFGGLTKIKKDLNTPLNKELLISLGGILFQILLYLSLVFPFREITKNIFIKYNTSILLFNLLPIIPLDGSIIFSTILNKYIPFKKTMIIKNIISIIFIIIYLFFNYRYSINNYFIIILFVCKTLESIKNIDYYYNKFLLERYLNNYKFKYLNTKKGNLSILKVDTYQYFIEDDKILSEKQKLQKRFDK